jgi:hypothetical protein
MDLGAPSSYLTLEPGMPVYSAAGELLGEVERVIAEEDVDIFDGIVFRTGHFPASQERYVEADAVGQIHERGVLLALDAASAERLPEPPENAEG